MTATAKKATPKKKPAAAKGRGSMTSFVAPLAPKPAKAPKQTPVPVAPIAEDPPRRGRRKVFDERRPLIVRLSPEQYRCIRQFALDESTTAQQFAVDAFREAFERRGLTTNAKAFERSEPE